MIVSDIITAARDMYNATGDTFFTDIQIWNWIWQAQHELAKKAWIIERIYTTNTVAAIQSYTYPTNTIAVKRITVNGKKIKRITHRYDDAITLSNSTVTTMGWPIYYTDYNYTVSMRPIPDGVYQIQMFSYNDASQITSSAQSLDVPTLFQFDCVDYVLARMFAKDKDSANMETHMALWSEHIKDAIAYKNRMKRSDSFATVQSEDVLPVNIVGEN